MGKFSGRNHEDENENRDDEGLTERDMTRTININDDEAMMMRKSTTTMMAQRPEHPSATHLGDD